jgi:tetratricopeptide (TPR) repeat protein
VTQKLQDVVADHNLDLETTIGQLDESLHATLILGARNVFLEELLDLARLEGVDAVLLQAATSSLPITPAGLARMLARDANDAGDEQAAERALIRLEDLALLHRFPDGSAWVHRWTAEGLARIDVTNHRARCIRAGRYRWWRVEHESHGLEDAVEAVRNFLAGEEFDSAVGTASACFAALRGFQQSIGIAALASEVLETLPEPHPGFAIVADAEAQAHLVLGHTRSALRRYTKLLAHHERLAQAEPDRADYQRDLSVSYNKMGDLYRALGQGEQAREAYMKSLAIAERLAQAEPDRADYQRDLVVSLVRVGIADDPAAGNHLQRALAILVSMKDAGRLETVDEPMIPELRRLLHDRPA